MSFEPPDSRSLTQSRTGDWLTVTGVLPPPSDPERANRLAEIGFIPGERVRILTRGIPGGDPLAVRVGHSTFALRKAEADCILVEPVRCSEETKAASDPKE